MTFHLKNDLTDKDYHAPHGGDIYRNCVETDFSVNTNPLGVRPEVLDAVRCAAEKIDAYPDIYCEELVEAIGAYEGLPGKCVFCGNGAAEIFFALTLAVRPERAMVVSPTFSEYEKALRVIGTKVSCFKLKETEKFRVRENILDQITEDLDIIFLCNPNNPTGHVIDRALMEKIANRCQEKKIILALDECFMEFLEEPEKYSMKEKLADYPNLVLIKAFTKLFCMPGVRLGYALSFHAGLLEQMQDSLQPWNVSVLAQEAGKAALKDCADYVVRTRRIVREERVYLKAALEDLGYEVYDSGANYIFFCDRREKEKQSFGKTLYERALAAGFLIRDCSNYRGLSNGYYRIAVKQHAENERLIQWLRQL